MLKKTENGPDHQLSAIGSRTFLTFLTKVTLLLDSDILDDSCRFCPIEPEPALINLESGRNLPFFPPSTSPESGIPDIPDESGDSKPVCSGVASITAKVTKVVILGDSDEKLRFLTFLTILTRIWHREP